MSELSFYINNLLSPPPDNWPELEIELDFTNNSPDASVRTTVFTWKGENAAKLNKWYKQGAINGVLGIWEGIPFRIMTGSSSPITCFDGCIDMTSPDTLFTCDIVKASCKETNRVYFLNDTAVFPFSYLAVTDPASLATLMANAAPGFTPITTANYQSIPYVIHSGQPDYFQVVLLGTSMVEMYMMIKSAYQTLYKLFEDIAAAVAGVAALSGYAILQIVVLVLEVIAYLLYIILLIAMLVALLEQCLNNLIGFVKYKYGMKVVDLFQKGCDYLGLGFSSTILQQAPYNNLVLMPAKRAYNEDNRINDNFFGALSIIDNAFTNVLYPRKVYSDPGNPKAYGYYDGTFKQFVMDMEMVFNAKIIIRNNVLSFERWDFWNAQAQYTMPPQSSDAPFEDEYGTNASELSANYEVIYQTDSSDFNTLDRYNGTSCQMQLLPKLVNVKNNVLLKGLDSKLLFCALAKRKEVSTVPEILINYMIQIIATPYNQIVNFIQGVIHLVNQIPHTSISATSLATIPSNVFGNRIGVMLLSTEFTSVPKLLVIDGTGKLDVNNSRADHTGYTDAYRLMRDFHCASWAVNTLVNPVTYPNQYLTFKDKNIPLCDSDFVVLRNNNIIYTVNQEKGRVDTNTWNPHEETAKVTFRVNKPFSKNLTQQFIIDGTPN